MNKKVIIIGSAWPLRAGGLATFNERLAKQFIQEGFDTSIYTFSLQYLFKKVLIQVFIHSLYNTLVSYFPVLRSYLKNQHRLV
jgi:hypothetical protein